MHDESMRDNRKVIVRPISKDVKQKLKRLNSKGEKSETKHVPRTIIIIGYKFLGHDSIHFCLIQRADECARTE